MVFTVNNINDTLYPKKSSYTPNEAFRDHSFIVNHWELRNEQVEELYGPFETKNYTTPTSRRKPIVTGNVRPLPRNEEKASQYKNMSLEQLKKMIADREALQLKKLNRLNNELRNAPNAPLPQLERKFSHPAIIVIEDDSDNMDLGSDNESYNEDMEQRNSESNSFSDKSEDAQDEQLNTEIISTSNKSEDEFNSTNDKSEDEQMITEPESIGDNTKETEDDEELDENNSKDSSSQDSYVTAAEQLMEEQDTLEEQGLIEEETTLLSQLKDSQNSVKSLQVELLGIKVRMSLNKNKNETKKKIPPPSAAPLPKLGAKRSAPIIIDDHPPPQQRKSKRNKKRHDIPGYNYSATIPPPPFYQQLPVHHSGGFNNYVPPFYHPSQNAAPPPPPPTATRPVTPPPPPPPPAVPMHIKSHYNNLPRPRPHISEEKADVEPMKDAIQIENSLREVEQLISQRIFNEMISYPKVDIKRTPRPVRLVTVDGYTMPMHLISISEDKEKPWEPSTSKFILPAGVPVETEMIDSWYESPFYVMLRRKATGQPFNTIITPIVQEIIDSISPTDNLNSVKIGELYFANLDKALHIARIHSYQDPENEFLAALRLELSLYVYGNTKMFHDDYKEIICHLPLSVDVEWQRVRAEATFASQLPIILDILHRISLRHTSSISKESINLSSMTVEVLIRLLRLNGSKEVLRLLTNFEKNIDSEEAIIINMDDIPGLHLQENDKYVIWMLILFYYISNDLPEEVCSTWMNNLVKEGTTSKTLSLFMIDWSRSDILKHPLDRSTICGATNILLSMLSHFCKKACNDSRRKPLLVGVLRTFSSFLSCNPSYKNAGTLLLMRRMTGLIEQIPEIQEIIIELEIKVGSSGTKIVEDVYKSKKLMSTSNLYTLAFQVARCYYESKPFDKPQLLLVTSNILLYPLLDLRTKEIQLQIMDQLTQSAQFTVTESKLIVLVDTIRQQYLTAIGLDSLMTTNNNNQKLSIQKNLFKIPFAWMNLILLTVISKFLYPKTSVIRDSLDNNLKFIFEESMKKINSEDGKLVLFKYGQQLQLI